MPTFEEVEALALALSEGEREILIDHLIHSLPGEDYVDPEELAEAKRRDAEMDADPSACLSWEEFQDKMRQRFPFLKK
jgi:putative addiction module component (TIGR02574 family)